MAASPQALSLVPDSASGPAGVATHADLVAALDALRRRAPDGEPRRRVTLKQLSADTGIPVSTVHSYLSGRSVPPIEALSALVQVMGVGPRERTAWIDALDRVQTAVRRPVSEPARRTIAPPLRDFVGRAQSLTAMTEQWQRSLGRSPLLVLTGPGGIGKTSLALEWAHRHIDDFPDGSLQVDMDGFGVREPMGSSRAQRLLLTALGLNPATLPTDPDELAMFYQAETSGRRMLVLLDNVRDAAAVEPMLATGPGMTTLVTSRDTMRALTITRGVQAIRVPLLEPDEATVLLQRASGGADPERVAQAVDECGGLPLALRLTADSLSMPAGPYGRPTHLRLLVEGVDRGVRGAIQTSLDALDERAREAFLALGALPGRAFSADTVAAVLGPDCSEAMDELAGLSLVEPTVHGWSRHGLVGEVAWDLANTAPETPGRRVALLQHYVRVARALPDLQHQLVAPDVLGGSDPDADIPDGRPDLDAISPEGAVAIRDLELGSMLRLAAWGLEQGHRGLLAALLDPLAIDLDQRGEGSEVQELAEQLASDSQASPAIRWVGLRTRGRWAMLTGEPAIEADIYRRAVELLAPHPELESLWRHAMVDLGSALTVNPEREEGVEILRQAIELCREAHDPLLQGIAENALGTDLVGQQHYAEGIEQFVAAVASRRAAGNPAAAITPLANAVRAAVRASTYTRDPQWLVRARDLLAELETLAQGATLGQQLLIELSRASVLDAEGAGDAALVAIEHAGELARRSHDAWSLREVEVAAATNRAEARHFDEAIERAEGVLVMCRDMLDDNYEASVLVFLAEMHGRAGHTRDARECLAQAVEILDRLDLREAYAPQLADAEAAIGSD